VDESVVALMASPARASRHLEMPGPVGKAKQRQVVQLKSRLHTGLIDRPSPFPQNSSVAAEHRSGAERQHPASIHLMESGEAAQKPAAPAGAPGDDVFEMYRHQPAAAASRRKLPEWLHRPKVAPPVAKQPKQPKPAPAAAQAQSAPAERSTAVLLLTQQEEVGAGLDELEQVALHHNNALSTRRKIMSYICNNNYKMLKRRHKRG